MAIGTFSSASFRRGGKLRKLRLVTNPKRFEGEVSPDPENLVSETQQIVDRVISHLTKLKGAP